MSDPVADFLAREQDVLAEIDDNLLSNANNGPLNNGGLEEVHNEQTELVSGGGGSSVDLPSLENCETAAVTAPQPQRISANPSPASVGSNAKVEPEKIRKWREEQKLLLEKKDEEEEKKMQEMRAVAKKELDDWYAQREQKLTKTKTNNRRAEEDFITERDSTKAGAEWERIAKLCELNAKNTRSSSDLSRLRSMLTELRDRKE